MTLTLVETAPNVISFPRQAHAPVIPLRTPERLAPVTPIAAAREKLHECVGCAVRKPRAGFDGDRHRRRVCRDCFARVDELLLRRLSVQEVSDRTNLSRTVVKQRRDELGLPSSHTRLTDLEAAAEAFRLASRDHTETAAVRKVAAEFGVHMRTMRRALVSLGIVEPGTKLERTAEDTLAWAQRLLSDGMTYPMAAGVVGVSADVLRERLPGFEVTAEHRRIMAHILTHPELRPLHIEFFDIKGAAEYTRARRTGTRHLAAVEELVDEFEDEREQQDDREPTVEDLADIEAGLGVDFGDVDW